MDTVWMLHPQLPADQLINVPVDAVIGHRTAGWQTTDPPPPDEVIEGPWGALAPPEGEDAAATTEDAEE